MGTCNRRWSQDHFKSRELWSHRPKSDTMMNQVPLRWMVTLAMNCWSKWLRVLISQIWPNLNLAHVSPHYFAQFSSWCTIVRALGTRLEKAFQDPIESIKQEFGLQEENFFDPEEEETLAGPFSRVSLFITDKKAGKWVNTLIKGLMSVVMMKDVGAPITMIRIW